MPAMILGPRVVVQCQNTALTNALANIGDGVAGLSAGAGEALEVVGGAADNGVTPGTGARTVTIVYLTTAGTVATEVITLNGTTAVPTAATTVWRILDMWCSSFGTGLQNAGAITLRVLSAAGNRLSIPIARLRAAPGQFTVPAGYQFYFHGAHFSTSVATALLPLQISCQIEAEVNPADGSYNDGIFTAIAKTTGGLYQPLTIAYPGIKLGIPIPPLATIRARGILGSNNPIEVGGQFWGSLVKVGEIHKYGGPDPDGVWL